MNKKVLHIITGLGDGGAEGVLARLCLHSKQVQHVVISLTNEGKYGTILTASGVSVHCLGMNQGKLNPVLFLKLVRLIKVEQPDVVQTWMYHADFLGGIAARLAGVRRVFWGVRHSTLEKGKSKRSTIIIANLCAFLSKWVPDIIICCANKAQEIHTEMGYEKCKFLVIPNGYDLSLFRPDVNSGFALRQEFGLDVHKFVVGMVGRFDPQKDHMSLLDAIACVKRKGLDFKCILVGENLTSGNVELMSKIHELGIECDVILAGQRADIPSVMNTLDLHILSSAYGEAFPNVIAEAMACGTPCISTDVGDALDIIGDSEACCLARDPQAMAALIMKRANEWQQDRVAWQVRKNASVQRIVDYFSIQDMVVAYETCWTN